MTLAVWTISVLFGGITLFGVLFGIFQYLNRPGHPKKNVVKKSFKITAYIILPFYLLGLFFVDWESKEEPATKGDIDQLRQDLLSALYEPSQEEVENEIDKYFQIEFRKKKKRALKEYRKCLISLEHHQYEDAVIHSSKAIKIFAIPPFYLIRGNAFLFKNDLNLSLMDYNKALVLDSNYVAAFKNRGIVWREKGEYDESIADFNKAIVLSPNNSDAYNGRGITWSKKGNYDRAIADYTKAIELNPKHADAYKNRGNAFLLLKLNKKAADDFNRYLEIAGDKDEHAETVRSKIRRLGFNPKY
jgi:tetratricopeptide (TPR) repeat protein